MLGVTIAIIAVAISIMAIGIQIFTLRKTLEKVAEQMGAEIDE